MKRLISLLLILAMCASLYACGSNALDPQKVPSKSNKGTISNPYSINDTIEFTGYQVADYNPITGKRTVELPSTFRFSNMVLRDDVTITMEDPGQFAKLLTFTFEIVESDAEEPVSVIYDYSLHIENINNEGVVGAIIPVLDDTGLGDLSSFCEFRGLSVLPGFKTDSRFTLCNTGKFISLISIEYCNEAGEFVKIYIDPNQ